MIYICIKTDIIIVRIEDRDVVAIDNFLHKEELTVTKIDIISGFLGAGKTTFIKKVIEEALQGQQIVLIENEFGEIGIDGGFLKESGIQINEMNSGCICCSLVGDFNVALKEVLDTYHPDRIMIEPSGVGKLSDVIKAVQNVVDEENVVINSHITIADAVRAKVYLKNFGEFYKNQVEYASAIILSRTQNVSEEKLEKVIDLMRDLNDKSPIVTTPWDELSGQQLLEVMEGKNEDFAAELLAAAEICPECGHHHEEGECCGHHHDHEDHDHEGHGHHHHDHEDHDHEGHGHHHDHEDHEHERHCHHHHDHEDHEHEGHGHHHDHEDHEHEGHCHHHHEHHDHDCHGHHHHHHDHHADEVFTSWGRETPKKYSEERIREILAVLSKEEDNEYGMILRAKGIVADPNGKWLHFDLVPGETEVRYGTADYTGRLCVIGADLKEDKLAELFGL